MKNSHIEWTDHTFNPWEGCTKVSPGCAHCYAEARNQRFSKGANWGKGAPRRRTSASNWNEPRKWNRDAAEAKKVFAEYLAEQDLTHSVAVPEPRRPRIFCASLADWLDDEVPIEWLADLLDLIRETPNLDWLLLTKRPQNWRQRIEDVADFECHEAREDDARRSFAARWFDGHAPANVWIGTTVEDQERADERIPLLLNIPAKVRFLSCEPLLGPVDLRRWTEEGLECSQCSWRGSESLTMQRDFPDEEGGWECPKCKSPCAHTPLNELLGSDGIHWVICGGESGPGARPMNPDWARSLRDQCKAVSVPFFFKQWGEWLPAVASLRQDPYVNCARWVNDGSTCGTKEGTNRHNFTSPELDRHSFKDGDVLAFRVGKKEAGRLLDGKEHSEFPEVRT